MVLIECGHAGIGLPVITRRAANARGVLDLFYVHRRTVEKPLPGDSCGLFREIPLPGGARSGDSGRAGAGRRSPVMAAREIVEELRARPVGLPRAFVKRVFDVMVERFDRNNILTYASAMAVQLLTAVIPLALLAFLLVGAFGKESYWRNQIAPKTLRARLRAGLPGGRPHRRGPDQHAPRPLARLRRPADALGGLGRGADGDGRAQLDLRPRGDAPDLAPVRPLVPASPPASPSGRSARCS